MFERDPGTRMAVAAATIDYVESHFPKEIQHTIDNTLMYEGYTPIETGATGNVSVTSAYAAQVCRSIDGDNLGIVSIHNYGEAGGGFMQGGYNQEAALCLTSNLFPVLCHFDAPTQLPMENGALLYTPGVLFIDDKNSAKPVDVIHCYDILCVAGPEELRKRIRATLGVASENGITTLVLSPIGRGLFGFRPSVVSSIYAEELQNFQFDQVIFAIPDTLDPETYRTFLETFKEKGK